MEDVLIRGLTDNGHFRVSFVSYPNLAEKVRKIHNTTPLSTIALTHFTGVSLLLSTGLKHTEQYSLHLKCSGVLKGFSSDVNSQGVIRVFPHNPTALINAAEAEFSVKKGIETGSINVIKWLQNVKQPYQSISNIEYSSIAQDFTLYLTRSEQIPSAIVLGEYIDKDSSVAYAGGLLIQAMPDAEDNEIGFIETTIDMNPSLIEMLLESYTFEMIMDKVVGIMGFNELSRTKPIFQCNCSKGRVESALISTGLNELEDIYNKNEMVEIVCEYCKNEYNFHPDEIKLLMDEIKSV